MLEPRVTGERNLVLLLPVYGAMSAVDIRGPGRHME